MVLIELKPKADYTDRILNPSPCGDYGSYELAYEESSVDAARNPSPCGDYGSYHKRHLLYLYSKTNVNPSPCGDYGSYL